MSARWKTFSKVALSSSAMVARSTVSPRLDLDELEAVVDDGERGEAEEVHLQQAHLLDGLHVIAGDDGLVLGARDGDELGERLRRDDDAGGVNAGAAHQAFETLRGVDQLLDLAGRS